MNLEPLLEREWRRLQALKWWKRPHLAGLLWLGVATLLGGLIALYTEVTIRAEALLLLGGGAAVWGACLGHLPDPDVLHEEQRAGTISLLFLAQIGPLDLIVSRFLLALMNGGFLTLGALPWFVVALARLPYPWLAAGRLLVAWLAIFMAIGSIGLFISAWGGPKRHVFSGLLGTLYLSYQGTNALGRLLHRHGFPDLLVRLFELLHPIEFALLISRADQARMPREFPWILGVYFTLSVTLVAASMRLIRRKWGRGFGDAPPAWVGGNLSTWFRRRKRRPLRDGNPIEWHALRWRSFLPWVVVFGSAAMVWNRQPASPDAFVFWFNLSRSALLLALCFTAFRQLTEDQTSRQIEFQLATGLSTEELVRGHWRATWREWFWALGGLLILPALYLARFPLPGQTTLQILERTLIEATFTGSGVYLLLQLLLWALLDPADRGSPRQTYAFWFGIGWPLLHTYQSHSRVFAAAVGGVAFSLGAIVAVQVRRIRRETWWKVRAATAA